LTDTAVKVIKQVLQMSIFWKSGNKEPEDQKRELREFAVFSRTFLLVCVVVTVLVLLFGPGGLLKGIFPLR
jgi:hypothetical protein